MTPATIAYEAVVRRDRDTGVGYMAVTTARYIGDVTITDWAWTGYGATVEAAVAALETRLREVHHQSCLPRRIVYALEHQR